MDTRILIVTAGRHGSTAGVAAAIEQDLVQRGAVVEACPARDAPEAASYDAAIIGSAIHFGRWLPEAVRFVESERESLRRIPVAYFVTCLDLTRVSQDAHRDTPIYVDPLLGRPPRVEGRLSRWERTHLLQHFVGSVTERAPEVEPVSVAAFRGRFDHNELSLAPRLLLGIARVASRAISERIPDGDFRNWEAIGEWTASLVPVLVNGGERGDSGR